MLKFVAKFPGSIQKCDNWKCKAHQASRYRREKGGWHSALTPGYLAMRYRSMITVGATLGVRKIRFLSWEGSITWSNRSSLASSAGIKHLLEHNPNFWKQQPTLHPIDYARELSWPLGHGLSSRTHIQAIHVRFSLSENLESIVILY